MHFCLHCLPDCIKNRNSLVMGRCPMIKNGQWQAVDTAKGLLRHCVPKCYAKQIHYINENVTRLLSVLFLIIFIWPYKRHPLTKGFQTNFIKLICRRLPLSFHCHLLCKLSVLPIIIILAALVVAWWRCGIVYFSSSSSCILSTQIAAAFFRDFVLFHHS